MSRANFSDDRMRVKSSAALLVPTHFSLTKLYVVSSCMLHQTWINAHETQLMVYCCPRKKVRSSLSCSGGFLGAVSD